MKNISISFMLLILIKSMNAQEYKRNYNWVIGLESIQFKFTKNNIVIDTLNNLDQKQFPFVYSFNSNSSISDTLGNL